MYLLLDLTYQRIAWHVRLLIPFSIINNNSSNRNFVFLKAAFHAIFDTVRKRAGVSAYISTNMFRKFSNRLTNNTVSLRTKKS